MRRMKTDPLKHLVERFNKARKISEKTELAMVLLPYAYPKLKAVEHKVEATIKQTITVEIGGDG